MTILKKVDAFFDPMSLVIILACLAVGGYYMTRTDKIDAPLEQAAEAVLHTEGIDIDFSAKKKAEHAHNIDSERK